MSNFDFPVSKTILLTGAGFTHNFGGFLAKTMWAEIHNRLQRSNQTRLIQKLKNEFNYEDLYQQIVYGTDYSVDEKKAFYEAVLAAYDLLDGVIREYRFCRIPPINLTYFSKFISRFAGDGNERGFFFTLNQDLFIERYHRAQKRLVIPGGINSPRFNIGPDKILEPEDFLIVPTKQELERHKKDLKNLGDLYYVKLHGSYDFRDKNNQQKLVIGLYKDEQIENEPILAWYFRLFKQALSLRECRLLIIGYGFRDPHINKVIVRSVMENNMKIFIISPKDPGDFRDVTLAWLEGQRDIIWEAIAGYYPYTLVEFFPDGTSLTQAYREFEVDFFDK